ncbi:hypothetical protein HDU86_006691 [Geranomyces michiganensis]|nr:hypothetical protein HDU86_006691 [Geranomyces michiganensis]
MSARPGGQGDRISRTAELKDVEADSTAMTDSTAVDEGNRSVVFWASTVAQAAVVLGIFLLFWCLEYSDRLTISNIPTDESTRATIKTVIYVLITILLVGSARCAQMLLTKAMAMLVSRKASSTEGASIGPLLFCAHIHVPLKSSMSGFLRFATTFMFVFVVAAELATILVYVKPVAEPEIAARGSMLGWPVLPPASLLNTSVALNFGRAISTIYSASLSSMRAYGVPYAGSIFVTTQFGNQAPAIPKDAAVGQYDLKAALPGSLVSCQCKGASSWTSVKDPSLLGKMENYLTFYNDTHLIIPITQSPAFIAAYFAPCACSAKYGLADVQGTATVLAKNPAMRAVPQKAAFTDTSYDLSPMQIRAMQGRLATVLPILTITESSLVSVYPNLTATGAEIDGISPILSRGFEAYVTWSIAALSWAQAGQQYDLYLSRANAFRIYVGWAALFYVTIALTISLASVVFMAASVGVRSSQLRILRRLNQPVYMMLDMARVLTDARQALTGMYSLNAVLGVLNPWRLRYEALADGSLGRITHGEAVGTRSTVDTSKGESDADAARHIFNGKGLQIAECFTAFAVSLAVCVLFWCSRFTNISLPVAAHSDSSRHDYSETFLYCGLVILAEISAHCLHHSVMAAAAAWIGYKLRLPEGERTDWVLFASGVRLPIRTHDVSKGVRSLLVYVFAMAAIAASILVSTKIFHSLNFRYYGTMPGYQINSPEYILNASTPLDNTRDYGSIVSASAIRMYGTPSAGGIIATALFGQMPCTVGDVPIGTYEFQAEIPAVYANCKCKSESTWSPITDNSLLGRANFFKFVNSSHMIMPSPANQTIDFAQGFMVPCSCTLQYGLGQVEGTGTVFGPFSSFRLAPIHVSGDLVHEASAQQQNGLMATALKYGNNADLMRFIQMSGIFDPVARLPIDETGEAYIGRAMEVIYVSLLTQVLHYAAPNKIYTIPLGTATGLTAVMGIPAVIFTTLCCLTSLICFTALCAILIPGNARVVQLTKRVREPLVVLTDVSEVITKCASKKGSQSDEQILGQVMASRLRYDVGDAKAGNRSGLVLSTNNLRDT